MGEDVAQSVAVDRVPQPSLRLHLVSLGHSDLPHVVTNAGDLHPLAVMPRRRRPKPTGDGFLSPGLIPMAYDHLPGFAEPGTDIPEFPASMGGLVQVHEVHVDGGPGNLPIELRMEMAEGFRQTAQRPDPHLSRAERVHPCYEPDGLGRCIGLPEHPVDLLLSREDGFGHDADG
jgi:hypothetical protein